MDYSNTDNAPKIPEFPDPTIGNELKADTPYDLRIVSQYATFAAHMLAAFFMYNEFRRYVGKCYNGEEIDGEHTADLAAYLLPYADSFWLHIKKYDAPFLISDIGGNE